MIQTPTVFVLGAGASAPFGFPLGSALKNEICKSLSLLHSGRSRGWEQFGYHAAEQIEFLDTLRRSGYKSADAFLETRPEFIEIGKISIASALIPKENPDTLFSPEAPMGAVHWYEDILDDLEIGKPNFGENKLTIITFNYDRSFEYYFQQVIKTRLRCTDSEALDTLEQIARVMNSSKPN